MFCARLRFSLVNKHFFLALAWVRLLMGFLFRVPLVGDIAMLRTAWTLWPRLSVGPGWWGAGGNSTPIHLPTVITWRIDNKSKDVFFEVRTGRWWVHEVVITSWSWLPNGGHVGLVTLDFWISPKLQESTEIEQKVAKTDTRTLVLAKNKKLRQEKYFS